MKKILYILLFISCNLSAQFADIVKKDTIINSLSYELTKYYSKGIITVTTDAGDLLKEGLILFKSDTIFKPILRNEWRPSQSGTTFSVLGFPATVVGLTYVALSNLSNLGMMPKARLSTTATAGNVSYARASVNEAIRGNVATMGGFEVSTAVSSATLSETTRAYVGLSSTSTTNPTNIDPITSNAYAKIGLAINSNAGNWQLVHNAAGNAPTAINLTVCPNTVTNVCGLYLFAKPNDTKVFWRATNVLTGDTQQGNITTNLPANNAILGRYGWVTNNTTAAINAINIHYFNINR